MILLLFAVDPAALGAVKLKKSKPVEKKADGEKAVAAPEAAVELVETDVKADKNKLEVHLQTRPDKVCACDTRDIWL